MPKTTEPRQIERETVVERIVHTRQSVFSRFPLPFTLLGTFGVVATFSGVQQVINKTPFLANNPIVLILAGLATLTLTGTLYKKLG